MKSKSKSSFGGLSSNDKAYEDDYNLPYTFKSENAMTNPSSFDESKRFNLAAKMNDYYGEKTNSDNTEQDDEDDFFSKLAKENRREHHKSFKQADALYPDMKDTPFAENYRKELQSEFKDEDEAEEKAYRERMKEQGQKALESQKELEKLFDHPTSEESPEKRAKREKEFQDTYGEFLDDNDSKSVIGENEYDKYFFDLKGSKNDYQKPKTEKAENNDFDLEDEEADNEPEKKADKVSDKEENEKYEIIDGVKYPKNMSDSTVRELKDKAKRERFEREKKRWGTHAKNWGGEALMLASALPAGSTMITTAGIARILAPKVGSKAAGVLAKMIADGAYSGAAYGAGESLQKDENPFEGAAKGAILGTATGIGLYGAGRKIAKNIGKLSKNISDDVVKSNKENKYGQIDKRTNSRIGEENQNSRGKTGTLSQSDRRISGNNYYKGNDESGLFVRRNGLWVINFESENPFNKANLSNIRYKELPKNYENGNIFYNAISETKAQLGDLGASVHTYTPEEYSQMKLFLSEDKMSGVAVKSDGDVVSVFVNPNAKKPDYIGKGNGRGHALVELAKQNGGKKLDCFDTYLPDFYKKHGFKEVRREKWNERYKPEGWNK